MSMEFEVIESKKAFKAFIAAQIEHIKTAGRWDEKQIEWGSWHLNDIRATKFPHVLVYFLMGTDQGPVYFITAVSVDHFPSYHAMESRAEQAEKTLAQIKDLIQ